MQSPLTTIPAGPDPDFKPTQLHGKTVKPNKFPACEQVYHDYYECVLVTNKSWGKFFGACNQFRASLDACNKEQQVIARKANHEKARLMKEKMQEREKKYDDMIAKMQTDTAKKEEKKSKSWW